MYSNEFKQSEKNPQPSNAYFMMFSFENVNYLRSTEGLRSPQNADHADCRLQTADRADCADRAD